ncbi:hypothetical protein HJG60_011491 [Phyllostomus discolor]|uniref:Uncharacterized protein n=1 Tax=Phyllostomus discolor TaxID=89673 RepID=A0A833ZNL7_9CHIR|nr:hypothetical protein HJG60_011491 [Phyllostomus discolor]
MSLFWGFINSFRHCQKSFLRCMGMFYICFTRDGHFANGILRTPKKSVMKLSRFTRSNQESQNLTERLLRRFISHTSHNTRVTTQVSFLKSISQASNYQSPSGNLFSESITQEMSWVNTEDSPI